METPLGVYMGKLLKYYFASITRHLSHLSIDRYYYPLCVLNDQEFLCAQKDLGEQLGVDKVTVVRLLDYLEEHKCLVRIPDQNDRRIKKIELTSKGESYALEIAKAMKAVDDEILEEIEVEQRKVFKELLSFIYETSVKEPIDNVELTLKNKEGI